MEHSLHVVVLWVLADVADVENDRLFADVLPPMRGATGRHTPFGGAEAVLAYLSR